MSTGMQQQAVSGTVVERLVDFGIEKWDEVVAAIGMGPTITIIVILALAKMGALRFWFVRKNGGS